VPRPNTTDSLKRNTFLSIPLRAEEKRRIVKAAEDEGVSVAAWARGRLLGLVRKEKAA
jgi:hypothetical protein